MSADAFVVFYGTALPLAESEVTSCEERTHPLIKAAREARLNTYWADFIPNDDQGPELLIGKKIGVFGLEGEISADVGRDNIEAVMNAVDTFLNTHGLATSGKLIIRFCQDI